MHRPFQGGEKIADHGTGVGAFLVLERDPLSQLLKGEKHLLSEKQFTDGSITLHDVGVDVHASLLPS
jgi:hypothetical protein